MTMETFTSTFGLASKSEVTEKKCLIHKVSARIDLLVEEYIKMFHFALLGGAGFITAVVLGRFVFRYERGFKLNFRMLFKHMLKMSLSPIGMFF